MKQSISLALKGLLLVPMIALGINAFTPAAQTSSAQCLTIECGSKAAQGDGQKANLFTGDNAIFKTITNVLLFLIGAISVIMLIFGGIRYTVSGGDSGAVTNAKNTILYAIVGIIVALLAFAIVNFVLDSFAK